MMFGSRQILLGLCFLLAGCSSAGPLADYDLTANFHNRRTFVWAPGFEENIEKILDPATVGMIKGAIERSLSGTGLQKSSGSTGDLWVGFHLAADGHLSEEQFKSVYKKPYESEFTMWGKPAAHQGNVREGTLIIDVLEPSSARLIWRGQIDLSYTLDRLEEGFSKIVAQDIEALFHDFPPQ